MIDQALTTLDEFRGVFRNYEEDSVPPNHFKDALNLEFGPGFFRKRQGIVEHLEIEDVRRIEVYEIPGEDNRLLILNGSGEIFDSTNLITPILTVEDMTDFSSVSIFGKAYISPHNGQTGLEDEVVYIYDGTNPARPAAGSPPAGFDLTLTAVQQTPSGTDIVAPVAPANGSQVLTTSPYIPNIFTKIKLFQTGGAVTAITVTVTGFGPSHVPQSEIYVDKILSAGPTTYTTGELWEEITDITISDLAGAGGQFKVETFGTNIGKLELGYHVVGVVYETTSGFLTQPGPENNLSAIRITRKFRALKIEGIPAAPGTHIAKTRVVISKFITRRNYSGNPDPQQYEMFFVPEAFGGHIAVGRTSTTINIFDADLVDSADYLLDNLTEIPASVALFGTSKGRLLTGGEFDDSAIVIRASKGGEPESMSATDGFVICDPTTGPVRNFSEYRDSIYAFKSHATVITQDNGDLPSTWQINIIDRAVGAECHAVATVIGREADVNDAQLIADRSGLQLFNGAYAEQALSWKIKEIWDSANSEAFYKTQIAVDPVNKLILVLFQAAQAGQSGTQKVLNPGLETGDFTNWTEDGTFVEVVANPGGGFSGSFIAEFDITEESGGENTQVISVDEGEVATISIKLQSPDGLEITARALTDNNFYLKSDGTWEESFINNWATHTNPTVDTFSVVVDPVPAGATSVTLSVSSSASATPGSVRWDDYTWTIGGTDTIPDTLLLADYSEGLNWQDIKWCPWVFQDINGDFIPETLVSEFDPSTSKVVFRLGGRNASKTYTYRYGSEVRNDDELAFESFWETYKYSASEAGAITHIAGMRIKITGFGAVDLTLIGPNDQPEEFPASFPIPTSSGGNILQKLNFVDDDISIRGDVNGLDHHFQVSKLWLFGTQIWGEKPSGLEFDLLLELIESWELSEASGDRTGIQEGLVLTDFGGVGSSTGVDGEVCLLNDRSINQYLTRALSGLSDPLIVTNADFSISMWVYFETLPTQGQIYSLLTGPQNQYQLFFQFATAGLTVPRFDFGYYSDAGFTLHRVHTGTDVFSAGVWYLVNCRFNFDTLELNLQINNERICTAFGTLPPATPVATNFRLCTDFAGANRLNGRMQYVRLWRRLLTDHEWEYLYNHGNGRDYENLNTRP